MFLAACFSHTKTITFSPLVLTQCGLRVSNRHTQCLHFPAFIAGCICSFRGLKPRPRSSGFSCLAKRKKLSLVWVLPWALGVDALLSQSLRHFSGWGQEQVTDQLPRCYHHLLLPHLSPGISIFTGVWARVWGRPSASPLRRLWAEMGVEASRMEKSCIVLRRCWITSEMFQNLRFKCPEVYIMYIHF